MAGSISVWDAANQLLEYRGFGLGDRQAESRDMFDKAISLVRVGWTEERVTFNGRYYQAEDLPVHPKPLRKPYPPISVACVSPATLALAGRYGFNVPMSGAFGLLPEGAKQGIRDYPAARQEAGFDRDGGQVAPLLKVYAGDTMDGARRN
jgi:alkanesulfonate monooxygenase SsuD/methylene tetrahydromethanopterin reductase-like flavin-dependent oxidoreductase (luciferase family)